MERLVVLTGSVAAAEIALLGLQPNYAHAAIVAENDQRIATSRIEVAGVRAYQATPRNVTAEASRNVVVVIHENRGLNPHIEDVARRIAAEGYLAVAPDMLTSLGGTPADADAARDMFAKLDLTKTVMSLAAIVDHYKKLTPPKKVGAIGFCWGGGMVNNLAVAAPGLDAGVVYYGISPKSEDVPRIRASLMMHYAGNDKRINDTVPGYEEALKKSNVKYRAYMYDGAQHAFNNETSAERYDANAAKLAWERTMAFFKETLGSSAS
ncbi:MAG: dienelactone hydrolase family protein [Beijerinckiaceae bacterium]|nr:dienelactone hydrolase family protein [Beijerinckiaceae bacterium]